MLMIVLSAAIHAINSYFRSVGIGCSVWIVSTWFWFIGGTACALAAHVAKGYLKPFHAYICDHRTDGGALRSCSSLNCAAPALSIQTMVRILASPLPRRSIPSRGGVSDFDSKGIRASMVCRGNGRRIEKQHEGWRFHGPCVALLLLDEYPFLSELLRSGVQCLAEHGVDQVGGGQCLAEHGVDLSSAQWAIDAIQLYDAVKVSSAASVCACLMAVRAGRSDATPGFGGERACYDDFTSQNVGSHTPQNFFKKFTRVSE